MNQNTVITVSYNSIFNIDTPYIVRIPQCPWSDGPQLNLVLTYELIANCIVSPSPWCGYFPSLRFGLATEGPVHLYWLSSSHLHST